MHTVCFLHGCMLNSYTVYFFSGLGDIYKQDHGRGLKAIFGESTEELVKRNIWSLGSLGTSEQYFESLLVVLRIFSHSLIGVQGLYCLETVALCLQDKSAMCLIWEIPRGRCTAGNRLGSCEVCI